MFIYIIKVILILLSTEVSLLRLFVVLDREPNLAQIDGTGAWKNWTLRNTSRELGHSIE